MNAVERITHYGNTIPQEPKDNLVSVPEDWPTKGSVVLIIIIFFDLC